MPKQQEPDRHSWKDFIEQTILNATTYTGNKEPGQKIFSGSMLGNDPLQNYLKYIHGSHDSKEYGANTLGSELHLAREHIFNDLKSPEVETELSLKYKLDNGWIVSGTMDLVLHKYQIIIDHKVTTTTAIKKAKSEGVFGSYALQLGVYKWLFYKTYKKEYDTALSMIDKNFSYFKENKYNILEQFRINTLSLEEIEQMLYDKTNELDEYIKTNTEPPQCTNLFFFKPKGATVARKMRCEKYCDNNINCKYYSSHSAMNSLLDL